LRCLRLLFLNRELALRFETVFVIWTFSGLGSAYRRHHRKPRHGQQAGGAGPTKRARIGTMTVTLYSTGIASRL
jgi:hypothetical protein